jgi:hypothetical protein
MQIQVRNTKQIDLPRYRLIRGFEGRLVRVDIPKAQEAIKHAMMMRGKQRRASDEARNVFVSIHDTQ